MNDFRSEPREIMITDLFWKIVHRWRFIVVCSFALALILGGVRYAKNLEELRNKVVDSQEADTIENIKMEMTEKELAEISDAIFKYNQLLVKQHYLDASIYMNLNPYAKDVVTLNYYVDTDYIINYTKDMEPNYANELIDAYTSYIENQGIVRGIREYLDWDTEEQYLGELISVGGRLANNGNATVAVNSSGNMFVIYVAGENKEKAEELAGVIEKALASYQKLLAEKIGGHSLTLVDHYYSVVADDLLASEKQALIGAIESYQTKLQTITDAFSDNQKIVFLKEIQEENGVFAIESPKPQPVEVASKITSTSFLIRDMFIGAVIGSLFACVGIAVVYSINGKVKLNEELSDLYGLRVFGNIRVKKKNKIFAGIDQWISLLEYRKEGTIEEQTELIITNLQVTCKNENIKKLFFTSTLDLTEDEKLMVDRIMSELRKSGVETIYGERINRNAESFERMSQIGQVVLIEKEMASFYGDVEREIVLCKEQNVNILGILGLRPSTV